MVPFAGYDMPVQYPTGVLREHLHTRTSAGLSMSRIWPDRAAAEIRPALRMPRWHWNGWCAGHRRDRARPAALRAIHRRQRRHSR